ncbi:hypothetical protein [Streptomyces sp. ODS28]|uniref:aspartate racemase/maleate isomerase family protein n=1 Tax=Streptomyces sp. ODS28 TaxID=3136688 RepID=UPI0031E7B9A3
MPLDAHESLLEPRVTRHVGVLLPWANRVVEEELPQLAEEDVVFHYARLVPASRTTILDRTFLHELRSAAAEAVESLRHLPLQTTLLACTSAGFTGGPSLPTGVVTAFDALTSQLHGRRLHRILLATPYPEPVTVHEAHAITARGIQVLAHTSLGLEEAYPSITPRQILELCASFPPGAVEACDALVLSCTGWRTLAAARLLSHALSRPVLTSNLALATYTAPAHQGACSCS